MHPSPINHHPSTAGAPALPPDIALSVRNVSKKFCSNLKRSMGYGMRDLGRELIGWTEKGLRLRQNEFLAVDDVSLDLKRGEVLGLIGANGCGKTTLLRLITGIFPPDAGELAIRGRVGALIALGAGFHPHMTGRENVYLNGSILGMTREELDAKFDEMIAFAEIGDFLEAPVATYSSGMRVRLGFAIAVHVHPEILLVDEVLAVGDMAFQEKCMRKMDELRTTDCAIILVTHSLYRVEALCNRAVWMSHGKIVEMGTATEVVRHFMDTQERQVLRGGSELAKPKAPGAGADAAAPTALVAQELLTIDRVECVNTAGEVTDEIPFASDLTVRIHYTAHRRIENPLFNIRIFRLGRSLVEACMLVDGYGPDAVEGPGVVECTFPQIPLTPKVYEILIFVRDRSGANDVTSMRVYATFRITDVTLSRIPLAGPMAVNTLRQSTSVYVPRQWRFYRHGKLTNTLASTLAEANDG